jgi:hypothetical protein
MKYLAIIILFNAFIFNTQAQTNKKAKIFVIDFFEQLREKDASLFFREKAYVNDIDEIISVLKEQRTDTLRSYLRINNKLQVTDSLIFSKQEKKMIIEMLKEQRDVSFQNELSIPNSKAISEDTLKNIFKNSIDKGWDYFHKNYGNRYYSFSIPVFFRNNTLCAFYYSYTCGGLCGTGIFSIYRKINGKWESWFTLYEWES